MIDIKTMRAAGLSDGQILRVLELDQEERLARRREQNRINKKNQRSRHHVIADSADSADSADTPSSSPPSLSPSTPPPITTPTSPSPARSLRSRGTRLPADWTPSKEDQRAAVDIGLSPMGIHVEGEKFRDYWHARAGPGGAKCDWSATWRNWCRKATENVKGNGHHSRKTLSETADDLIARAKQLEVEAGLREPDPFDIGGPDIIEGTCQRIPPR